MGYPLRSSSSGRVLSDGPFSLENLLSGCGGLRAWFSGCFHIGFSIVPYAFRMVVVLRPHGFRMVLVWFSHGFRMIFLWFSLGCSCGVRKVFVWRSYGCLLVFVWFSCGVRLVFV